MYLLSDIWRADQHVRPCSNCDRPATREADVGSHSGPAVYSCWTCGQREAVSWQIIPSGLVKVTDTVVVEEPHVILGEH